MLFRSRNALSATFMNFVAGVSPESIQMGVRAAHAIKKGPEAWAEFLAKQSPEVARNLEEAYKVTMSTGRGVSDMLSGVAIRGKGTERIINNRYTRFFQRRNEGVELSVRMPMAYDSLMRGQTYDQAAARVTRYHFDYSDLTEMDQIAKVMVPFWIWTSRNVPLQIVEQWTNPSIYRIYDEIKKNNPVSDKIMMPKWIADWEPMGAGGVNNEGGQWVITPDLPMTRLQQQLEQFVKPSRVIGSFAPIVKLPIEMAAGKQLGIDVGPFKTKQMPARGMDKVFAQVANFIAGENLATRDPKTGEWVLDERVPYFMQNILPFLGQINRVSGGITGGKTTYSERQLGNLYNWLGIPVRYVGPEQQSGEAIGRQFDLRDYVAELVRQGKLTKKK